jgi:hypothetical protein
LRHTSRRRVPCSRGGQGSVSSATEAASGAE